MTTPPHTPASATIAITALPALAGCRLWRVALDAPAEAAALHCLAPDEQARAARFVFPRDAARFAAARAALRQLLAAQTGVDAAALRFALGHNGKPQLAPTRDLQFNLSHSQGWALIACGPGTEIGVDVECLRPMADAQALAARHFDAAEQTELDAIPAGPARDRVFLQGWTRKEACLKAVGVGLGLDTRSFHTGLAARACTVQMTVEGRSVQLSLQPLDAGETLVAALARITLPTAMAQTQAAAQAREFCA